MERRHRHWRGTLEVLAKQLQLQQGEEIVDALRTDRDRELGRITLIISSPEYDIVPEGTTAPDYRYPEGGIK